jgi:hypothetical protein
MRPLTVITGIEAGSCLSIAVSLAAVLFVYLILGDEYPRVRHEFKPLLASMFIFLGMTAISAVSFYAMLINHKMARLPQLAMWASLAACAYYYAP